MAYNKGQHTVQKAYLLQWGEEFYLYDLKNQRMHDKARPKDIFKENYIYNWKYFEGQDQFIVDRIVTKIENDGFPIIRRIQQEPITDGEKYHLAKYIALQALRTPLMKEKAHYLEIKLMKDNLINIFKDPQKKQKLLSDMEKNDKLVAELAIDPEKNINQLFEEFKVNIKNIKEIWLQTSLRIIEDITESYYNASWLLLEACKNSSFITADNPVVIISKIKDGDVCFTEISFPLSPKFLLLIKKNNALIGSIYKNVITENSQSVRELNSRTAMFADRYIVSSFDRLLFKMAKIAFPEWEHIRKEQCGYFGHKGYLKNKFFHFIDR